MPAIQNQINLYVNANGQLVPGSEPSDVLYRNNINRNVFFVITPLSQASVVKMIFRNASLARQGYTGIAFATNQKGANITSEEVSYYELVKDWSVFKFVPNSTILTKFPSSISGSIGLTVSIKEPDLSDKTQWTFKDNVLDINYDYSTIKPREYIRCLASSLAVPTFGTIYSGDCIVNVPDKGLTLIRLLWTRSTTEPLLFVGNPALEDTDFEDAEIGDASLLDTVVSMQTQQTQAIVDVNDRMLPKDGSELMEGNLNMDGYEIVNADNIQFSKGGAVGNTDGNDFTIVLKNGETFIFSENGLNMFLGKLTDVAKGVNPKDGANMENINDIKDGTTIVKNAEQDQLGNVINTTYETKAVVGGINTRVINLENANMVKSVAYQPLTHIITFTFFDNTTQSLDLPLESTIVGASYDNITKNITFTLQNGSTLVVPLDDLVQGLASETWVTTYFIPKTSIVDNLTTNDATKVLSAKQGKELQDTKEALSNKKSVINDSETEYPNSKAVKDELSLKTNFNEYYKTKLTKNYSYYSNVKSLFGDSIIAFYPLNEFEGTVAYDISGNKRNGVYRESGITWGKSPFGDFQSSPKLDGVTGLINIKSSSLENAFSYNEGTLFMQLKHDGAWDDGVAGRTVFSFYRSESGYIQIRKSSSGSITLLRRDANGTKTVSFANQQTSAFGFSPIKTFNVVATWSVSKNKMDLYINGYFISTINDIANIDLIPFYMVIGGETPTNDVDKAWKGEVSNVILLNNHVTSNEVKIYNELLNDEIKKISVIGDSITNDLSDFPTYIVNYATDNIAMRSFGVAGNSILNDMETQTNLAVKENADIIILELGANDDNLGNMTVIQNILETQINRLKASNPKAKIYYMNILPAWTDTTGTTPIDKSNLRNTIYLACQNTGITCWDVSDWLVASDTIEGLHPNNQGSYRIALKIIEKLGI